MGIEIERKFLVHMSRWSPQDSGTKYMQGYLSTDPDRTVRVRLAGAKAFLTIKGRSKGATRAEFEYEIPAADAKQLLEELALSPIIVKTRHLEKVGQHTWEIDVFERENAGLVMAEVELKKVDEVFELPSWAGKEVTNDHRYQNASLSAIPFSTWGE